MKKDKRTNNELQITTQKTKRSSNMNPTKTKERTNNVATNGPHIYLSYT